LSSRKNTSKGKPRLLVDTSFLLPAIGIEVEKEVMEAIRYFRMAEVYYLEISILEAMWKVVKLVSTDKIDRVKEGIESIMDTYKRAIPCPEAYVDAYKLYHEGHKDYVDNLLYATSRKLNLLLLTADKEFIDFLEERGYPIDNIVMPEEMMKRAEQPFKPKKPEDLS